MKKNKYITAKLHRKYARGSMLIFAMIFGSIAFTIIILGVSGYALFEHRASTKLYRRDMALHIAEAGVNYYRWHLAHDNDEYTDGTGQPGPYVHEYHDKDGNLVGYFSLDIDEPLAGSSVVTVRSTGWTVQEPNASRTLQVRVGFPAMTDYAFLENADMSFSFTTVVHGIVHSNGNIRFDGTTDSWVRAHGDIQGGGGPKTFWDFPVPIIDFYSVTGDLDDIRTASNNGGIRRGSSGTEGWQIIFDGNQFDLYKVTSRDCYKGEGRWRRRWGGWYWDGNTYCFDVGNRQFFERLAIPSNGAMFFEDNVWVQGTVNGRVTIGVGKFPVQEPYKTLYINNNLTYAEKGGDDVVGLMAQGDIVVPYEASRTMEVNAAALSQFGSIYTPYYDPDENLNGLKDSLTFFGSQISYEGGGWKYVNGWGNVISGFHDTNHVYDGNLKYYPPPGFPVGTMYELISWEEIE
ncbi:MAG: hypothetical protein WCW16_02060 [Candidatus Magasanikbacteria bacterium]